MASQHGRLVALGLAVGVATLLVAQTPVPDEPLVVPLRVHDVCRSMSSGEYDAGGFWHAEVVTHPCPPEDWLDAQITTANSLFAPVGLQFRSSEQFGLTRERARIAAVGVTWDLVFPRPDPATRRWALDVLLVDELFSSADAGGMGWVHLGAAREFIVLAVTSENRMLLAHELGHYMGLEHSPERGNPMHETPGEGEFDSAQLSRLRARSRTPRPRGFDHMRHTMPWSEGAEAFPSR